jgi:hypothetical protein
MDPHPAAVIGFEWRTDAIGVVDDNFCEISFVVPSKEYCA